VGGGAENFLASLSLSGVLGQLPKCWQLFPRVRSSGEAIQPTELSGLGSRLVLRGC